MAKKKRTEEEFQGWDDPNFVPIPQLFFENHLATLKYGEMKVLLYLFRRTYGFRRDSDCVPISQFLDGKKDKNGKRVDRGVGLTKVSLLSALRGLVSKNMIFREQRYGNRGGNIASSYRLNLKKGDLGERLHAGDR